MNECTGAIASLEYAKRAHRRWYERICWSGLILGSASVFWIWALAWQLVIAAQFFVFSRLKLNASGEVIMRAGWYFTKTPMPILLAAVFFIWGATNWYSWTRPPDYDWEKVRKRSIRIVGIVLFLATVVTLFGITINMPMLLSQMTLKRFGFPW